MRFIQLRIMPNRLSINRYQMSVCANVLLIPGLTEDAALSQGRQPFNECQNTFCVPDVSKALSAPNEPWKPISKSLECRHEVVRAEIPESIFTLCQINLPSLILPERHDAIVFSRRQSPPATTLAKVHVVAMLLLDISIRVRVLFGELDEVVVHAEYLRQLHGVHEAVASRFGGMANDPIIH